MSPLSLLKLPNAGALLQYHLHNHCRFRIIVIITKMRYAVLFYFPPLSCRESVSLPLILDVGSSTLWEIDKCIEYTGVHGVAVSGKG